MKRKFSNLIFVAKILFIEIVALFSDSALPFSEYLRRARKAKNPSDRMNLSIFAGIRAGRAQCANGVIESAEVLGDMILLNSAPKYYLHALAEAAAWKGRQEIFNTAVNALFLKTSENSKYSAYLKLLAALGRWRFGGPEEALIQDLKKLDFSRAVFPFVYFTARASNYEALGQLDAARENFHLALSSMLPNDPEYSGIRERWRALSRHQ